MRYAYNCFFLPERNGGGRKTEGYMNCHIYSTLFKTQEREDRRSKEIEQRKESQNTHKQNNKDM